MFSQTSKVTFSYERKQQYKHKQHQYKQKHKHKKHLPQLLEIKRKYF